MNRESELLNCLRQPVRHIPRKWDLEIPFSVRLIHKPYGGRGKGRWLAFKDDELGLAKPFSDALVATLSAKGLLVAFSKENDRAFFLKDLVAPKHVKRGYVYEGFDTLNVYKRALKWK